MSLTSALYTCLPPADTCYQHDETCHQYGVAIPRLHAEMEDHQH